MAPIGRAQTNSDRFLPSLGPFARDIKFSHTVFALPFAGAGLVLSWPGVVSWSHLAFLLTCMVSARTFAMGANRFFDARIDGANPRTMYRAIPRGSLTSFNGLSWTMLAGTVFVIAATCLGPLTGWLSVPLLMVLASYSLMKRVTWLTHWYLGFCLGCAPVAVAIALTGAVNWEVLVLGAGVALWTAGFDILYALQDWSFDLRAGLYSAPARLGPRRAIWTSRLSFIGAVGLMVWLGIGRQSGATYYLGIACVACLLLWEQLAARHALAEGRLDRLQKTFFYGNAGVSLIFLATLLLDNTMTNAINL